MPTGKGETAFVSIGKVSNMRWRDGDDLA